MSCYQQHSSDMLNFLNTAVLLHTDQGLSNYIASRYLDRMWHSVVTPMGEDLLAHTLGQEMLHELCVKLTSPG